MRHLAVRHVGAVRDDAAERVLQERDHRPRAAHMQERSHRVIPLGTRTDARLLPRLAPAAAEALHQLFLRDILLMRGQVPGVAPAIFHSAFSVAIRLVGDRER